MKKVLIFSLVTLLLAGCAKEATVKYSTQKVTRETITTSITATGTIEPVTEVEVGTQVSGIIDKIYVDYNSVVKKGQVIAELDRTNLQSELTSAQSNLANAQASLKYQIANHKRLKELYDKGLIAADEYEQGRLSYEQAQQQVRVQEQNVQKAQTNLGYATITSPIDGVILSKAVEEGQTVASSFSTPTLFTIAQDLTDMRVIADIDEADIGGVLQGQRVTFTVDAYPDETFNGSVTQVRQEATTESNVVTYEVVISAPNDDLKLKPGLTANVTIYTMEMRDVVCVPSKALRFTPNEQLLKEGETIKDCKGQNKVWVRKGNEFTAIPVEVGITNGVLTEITSGIDAGTEILVDMDVEAEAVEEEETSNPFMPKPGGNKNKTSSEKK